MYQPTYPSTSYSYFYRSAYWESSTPLADAASIVSYAQYNNPSVAIYAEGYTLVQMTSAEGWSADTVGQSTCMAGYKTNYKCGALQNKSLDVDYPEDNKTLYSMRRVNFVTQGGDSGAPYFSISNRRWHGIHSGVVHLSGGRQRCL